MAGIGFLVFTNLDLFLHYSYDCVYVVCLKCFDIRNVGDLFECWKCFNVGNVCMLENVWMCECLKVFIKFIIFWIFFFRQYLYHCHICHNQFNQLSWKIRLWLSELWAMQLHLISCNLARQDAMRWQQSAVAGVNIAEWCGDLAPWLPQSCHHYPDRTPCM